MDLIPEQLIWFPGDVYIGREGKPYEQPVQELPIEEIVTLVQQRAEEDGEFSIANGMVGPENKNELKMRAMMAWVANEKHIKQCVEHIYAKDTQDEKTVDWVCRELARVSKALGAGMARGVKNGKAK